MKMNYVFLVISVILLGYLCFRLNNRLVEYFHTPLDLSDTYLHNHVTQTLTNQGYTPKI